MNNFNDEQKRIIDTCKSEKRSMTQEEVNRMNEIIELRACKSEKREDNEEDKEQEEKPVEDKEQEETEERSDETEPKKEEETEDEKPEKDEETEERSNKEITEQVIVEERNVTIPEITEKETINRNNNFINKMEFSLLKAINNVVNNRALDVVEAAANEKGLAEMRKAGLNYSGQILLPVSELRAVTVATEHDDVIETELFDIMEPLRAKNILVAAGAKFLTGLVGDIQVPTMSMGQVTWEGENAEAKEAEYTFSSVKLSPKRLTAYVDISKQFIIQDSKGAEALIRQDIVKALNAKLEATILGDLAGTTTQPAGIFAGADLEAVAGYEDICDLECKLDDANVFSDTKYIMSNKARAAFRCMAKSEHNQYVLENNAIDGTPVLNTSHISGKKLAYGDFSQLAVGQWGSVDLVVDPYTLATKGMIRLVINAYFDAKVLRPEAIVCGTVGE